MYTGNPFERNRYYAGKLLTSTDFLAEQDYNRGKHQLAMRRLFGSGILYGISAQLLDPHSIRVEPGMALDPVGRELFLTEPKVLSLSDIPGFSALKSDRVTLCLRLSEDERESVFAVTGPDSKEYNRIVESGELCLVDTASLPLPKRTRITCPFLLSKITGCPDQTGAPSTLPKNDESTMPKMFVRY